MESKSINNDIKATKESDNKITDNIRFMMDSLLKSVNKLSEIDKKVSHIDNKFTYNVRFMIDLLLKSVNKIQRLIKNNKYR